MKTFIKVTATICALLWQPAFAESISQPRCLIHPALPGSPADPGGDNTRQMLCAIDFASSNVALCPKNWSTSAAALIYTLEGTQWNMDNRRFEAEVCSRGTHARDASAGELAVFKHSMNDRKTSGTYAPSILLYDHLSRWLGTQVHVPAAVEHRFPATWYAQRVVQPGLQLAPTHRASKMLVASWTLLDQAIRAPTTHPQAPELFLDNGKTLFGASMLFTGRRYGAQINGTRESGWGSGQNYDFQHTAPFLLLRNPETLDIAVAEAITDARRDPSMAKALPQDIPSLQVIWWANEVLEIVVLDYLLGQQDRVGNIDYERRWVWLADGKVLTKPAQTDAPPQPGARVLRVSWLNDNDAGLRRSYTNFAKTTDMLTELRHFNPHLYRRLRELAADFRRQGPVYSAIRSNYHLRTSEFKSLAKQVQEVDTIIGRDCRAGLYRFDLNPESFLSADKTIPMDISCD